jgi:hypothetical protein
MAWFHELTLNVIDHELPDAQEGHVLFRLGRVHKTMATGPEFRENRITGPVAKSAGFPTSDRT